MKINKVTVIINKPISEVFNFATDPANTPKWVESIVVEQVNEWPIKLGTAYKNQNRSGEWSEYRVTQFDQDRLFVLMKLNGNYSVEYTFSELGDNKTKLVYRELVETGELAEPFTQKELDKLKVAIET